MKKLLAVLTVVALAGLSAAFACDAEKKASNVVASTAGADLKEVTLVGYLTDSNCGAANANAKGRQCALECIKKGAKVQLYAGETLYNLDKVEAPEKKVGFEVRVTGMLDEASNTIKVASIEQVKKG